MNTGLASFLTFTTVSGQQWQKSFLHPGNTLQMLGTHPALGTYINFFQINNK